MPKVEGSIVIEAPVERVVEIARDNARFPEFMSDVASVDVVERSEDGLRVVSDWVAIVPKFGNKVRWREEDVWDLAEGTCTFRQLEGDYDQFEGVWRFAPEGSGTRFASWLEYRLEIPLVGPLIKAIVHKTMQANLDSTLTAIRDRAQTPD